MYHKIIQSLGVECNLTKSVLSPSGEGLEFAKMTFVKGKNVTPIPLKELSSALSYSPRFLEFIRKHSISYNSALRILGYGYKSSSNSIGPRLLKILLTVPTSVVELFKVYGADLPFYHRKMLSRNWTSLTYLQTGLFVSIIKLMIGEYEELRKVSSKTY
jgi:hypothetical protein